LPSVLICGFLTWCAVELGEFDLAKRTTDRALRIVNKVAEPYSIVYAHLANGLYQLGRGHPHDAVTAFEAAKAISERSQMQLPIAGAWLAAAYVHAARPRDALSLLAEADRHATYRHGGMYNWFHHHLSMAQAYLAVSDVAAAQAAISRAQDIAVAAEEIVHLAWACKIQGDIAATVLNYGGKAARRAYVQALGIARSRGLRPLEAHCHAALAQLHERLGLPNEAARHRQNAEQIYNSVGIVSKFAPVGS
jgi:tetratricopeptide (TPR) repeat protein